MLEIGSYIGGKYKILNVIGEGEGGMSTVYLALDEKLNKTWAIKVAQRDGMKDDNKAIQGLIADKNTLVNLEHRHLPRIVDVFETETSMMLVMDFIAGKSLQFWTSSNGARPQADVIKWAKQLCNVIGYLHSHNIIYRDLKPANIMLDHNYDITLIDFGTARQYERIKNTVSLGTVGYAAPEQFVDSDMGQVDVRTDIYTIGATLHHLVTGIDPQLNPSFVKKPIREVNPQLSEGLESIIIKCLQNDQDARYQSCDELLVDLEHYEEIGGSIRKKQKRKVVAFVSVLSLSVLLAGLSAFGYVSANKQSSADYALKVQKASDTHLSQEERVALYKEAISIKTTQADAYLGLLDMFLDSQGDTGNLSRDEVAVLREIENGMNVESAAGYAETIYPLLALEQKDPAVYEEVCFEIGTAFWYDYEVESERHVAAVGWFERAKPSFPIAETYVNMGKVEQEIIRFRGQNRTEQMYASYEKLWTTLGELKEDASRLDDNDMKILIWREIVGNIVDNAADFSARVPKEAMLQLLDAVTEDAKQMKEETTLEAIEQIIEGLLLSIDEAGAKVKSLKG